MKADFKDFLVNIRKYYRGEIDSLRVVKSKGYKTSEELSCPRTPGYSMGRGYCTSIFHRLAYKVHR